MNRRLYIFLFKKDDKWFPNKYCIYYTYFPKSIIKANLFILQIKNIEDTFFPLAVYAQNQLQQN